MKIITPGQIPLPLLWWAGKHINCAFCKATFELEAEDKNNVEARQERRPGGLREIKVKCPTCGTQCHYSDHGEVQRL